MVITLTPMVLMVVWTPGSSECRTWACFGASGDAAILAAHRPVQGFEANLEVHLTQPEGKVLSWACDVGLGVPLFWGGFVDGNPIPDIFAGSLLRERERELEPPTKSTESQKGRYPFQGVRGRVHVPGSRLLALLKREEKGAPNWEEPPDVSIQAEKPKERDWIGPSLASSTPCSKPHPSGSPLERYEGLLVSACQFTCLNH